MPQDNNDLNNRMTPPNMDHLAEQIIARSKVIEQETPSVKTFKIPKFFSVPKLSYALATACCFILLAFVVTNNAPSIDPTKGFDVAEQVSTESEWEEFLRNEEDIMFAGL